LVVIVTGGAGFIGSHTVEALQAKDYELIAVDNFLYNASREGLRTVEWSGMRLTIASVPG